MKLSYININSFRSIKDATINIGDLTAIVGENNAGKSAILRAINCFFNYDDEEESFKSKSHQYSPRSITRIRLQFIDVPNDVNENVQNGELTVCFEYNYSKHKKTISIIANDGPINAPSDIILKIKNHIDYIYIKANRGDDDLDWSSNNSFFKEIVSKYLSELTQKRDSLSKKAKEAANSIKPLMNKFCRQLSEMNMLSNKDSFTIDHRYEIDYSIFLQNLVLSICTNNTKINISDFGSGVKSVTVIALYRLLAKIKNVSIILAIEEPETNLHPQAQKKLIASLKENRQDYEAQAIFATHSPVIIDSLEHDEIVLVRREIDTKRDFHSKISQLSHDFWNRHQIEEFKYNNFFKLKNSDFFFAKYVVVIEGAVDSCVYEYLLERKIKDKILDVSFLQLGGVKNIQYPYFLLKELEIPFTCILDFDFFTNYINGKLATSRNPDGFPIYRYDLKRSKVIDDIWNDQDSKNHLRAQLSGSYTSLIEELAKTPLLCKKFCLEMDLVHSIKTRNEYYRVLQIPVENQTPLELLTNKKDTIKDVQHLMTVVKNVKVVDLPISFKKITKILEERVNKVITI